MSVACLRYHDDHVYRDVHTRCIHANAAQESNARDLVGPTGRNTISTTASPRTVERGVAFTAKVGALSALGVDACRRDNRATYRNGLSRVDGSVGFVFHSRQRPSWPTDAEILRVTTIKYLHPRPSAAEQTFFSSAATARMGFKSFISRQGGRGRGVPSTPRTIRRDRSV
jgi:hypothetical protein